ncbi:MAG: response regulator [Candidatus Acidiferrum sp.]
MAKILVADDNSNIQKMVGLALKDQGIDVVAVGNGEAAVRKISDVRPDLVLADVFMPVRNGYEVCQYVKADSSLAHIPVILLVGAFDPLDEQEAQRVGADGVLKKPFVPPDPLISMVKSALARAGVAVGGVPPAPVREEPVRVAEMLTPRSAPAPTPIPSPALPEIPSVESDPIQDVGRRMPEPVKIDAGSQPLAFGNLLETSVPEPEPEDDIAYATTARPQLERDWKSGDDEEDEVEEEEEEEKSNASWRRDAGDDLGDAEDVENGPVKDWRETAFADAPARRTKHGAWTPQKEGSSFEEAAEAEQSVSAAVKEVPAAETKLVPTLVAPFTEGAWAAALNQKPGVEAATMEAPAPVPEVHEAPVAPQVQAEPEVSIPAKVEQASVAEKPATQSAWYSAVSSPWDAEIEKANKLASTWDAPAKEEPATSPVPESAYAHDEILREEPETSVEKLSEGLSEEVKAKVEEAALPAATVEAIREEAHQVTETVIQQVPASNAAAEAPKQATPSMEDMVAKVLSQMSPDMLQAVTREILKPVVEKMVRDELAKKQ